jgi:putative hydrolases of HD superfamily
MGTKPSQVADAVIELAELALAFGRIDRTGPCHPTGEPESDSDHTVMLCWVAPSLADLINARRGYECLNVGLVTQFAAVHDAVEVYAGDTTTIRITQEELAAKEDREGVAAAKLRAQFRGRLPWFVAMVGRYESQFQREARFVRAVDKVLPKIVHLLDGLSVATNQGLTRSEFVSLVKRQRSDMVQWLRPSSRCSGGQRPHDLVLEIYDVVCARVLQMRWPEDTPPPPPQPPAEPSHYLMVTSKVVQMQHTHCPHPGDGVACPYSLAYEMYMRGNPGTLVPHGEHPVSLDGRGELVFVDMEGK